MIPMTRRRASTAVAVVVAVLLAALAMYAFRDVTLDSFDDVDAALPTEKDMPGWSANRGIIGTLPPPKGDRKGKLVLVGGKLDGQCRIYRKKSNGWACDGLQGMGMVGYAYNKNVFTRVSSMVLAYEDSGAAEAAWKALVEKTRNEYKKAEEGTGPEVGDESRSFAMRVGTIVVLRSGSVVAQVMSHNDFGFGSGSGTDNARRDPIRMWSSVQAEKIARALNGK